MMVSEEKGIQRVEEEAVKSRGLCVRVGA